MLLLDFSICDMLQIYILLTALLYSDIINLSMYTSQLTYTQLLDKTPIIYVATKIDLKKKGFLSSQLVFCIVCNVLFHRYRNWRNRVSFIIKAPKTSFQIICFYTYVLFITSYVCCVSSVCTIVIYFKYCTLEQIMHNFIHLKWLLM